MGTKRVIVVLFLLVMFAGCASNAEREAERQRAQRAVSTQVELAATYIQRDRLDVAKEYLDRALEIDRHDTQANNVMAVLQWRLKDYREAESYFRKAIDADEKNSAAYHNFGAFLCDRGRIDEAVDMLDKAAANPIYQAAADANVNAGICLMNKPAPVAAEKYFREALRLNPSHPRALYYLAKITYDSGRTLPARALIQRHFEASADTPEALLLAVRIETALRDKNAASSYGLRLKSKFPQSQEAQLLAGTKMAPTGK